MFEGGEENQPLRPMRMGRWSEFRVFLGSHLAPLARWAVANVMSGDEGVPLDGTLVGVSVLRDCIGLSTHSSAIFAPLVSALLFEVVEYHAGSCALKSPMIRVSSVVVKRGARLGE